MADGIQLNTNTTSGDIVAADDITDAGVANGRKAQRVKPGYGADGNFKDAAIEAGNVDAATPRVTIATDDANLAAINAAAASVDAKLVAGTVIGDVNSLPKAFVSVNNSTASPLGISGVFTGAAWEDISNYSAISLIAFADVASAADGLVLQYSTNGTNIDHTQSHSVLAGVAFTIQAMKEAKFFRIVYTNGVVAQAVFRLQVIFNPHAGMGEVEQLDQPLNGDADAMLVRSVLAGLQPGGAYANVGITTGGNLKTSIEEADVSATGLAKAEDAAHASGDTGVATLAVRNDVLASLVDTDGDYAPFQVNDIGALWVHAAPNDVDPNNSTTTPLGSSAVFTGTATSMLDSAAVTILLDASHDSVANGMQFQFSTDGTNWDITHDFTYTAANGGRQFQFGTVGQYFRVVFTNDTTAQTHLRIQTLLLHTDPITTIHRIGDDVSPDRSATIHKSCILAQQGGGGPGAGDYIPVQATSAGNFKMSLEEVDAGVTLPVVGDVAHDAVDSGNPLKTGAKAVLFNGTAPPNSAVAEGDRVNHIADEYGRQYVETTHPNYWDASVDYAAAQTNATIKAAPGAGLSIYITDILCSNGATAGNITLLDGSGGTVKWELYPAINGGASEQRRSPIKLTANTPLAITSTTVTTHSLTISGYIAP